MLRLAWEPARRLAPGPLLAAGAVLAHGALVTLLSGPETPRWLICRFKALTGLPCPACGTGRAGLALLRGDLAGALVANPFMLAAGATALVCLGARLLHARAPRLVGTPRERRRAFLGALALLLANWAYLIAAGR